MSRAEDYGPCLACGASTDSGVCSEACANELDARTRYKHAAQWPNGCPKQCPDCVDRLTPEGIAR